MFSEVTFMFLEQFWNSVRGKFGVCNQGWKNLDFKKKFLGFLGLNVRRPDAKL